MDKKLIQLLKNYSFDIEISFKDLASELKISTGYLSRLINDKVPLGEKMIYKINKLLTTKIEQNQETKNGDK